MWAKLKFYNLGNEIEKERERKAKIIKAEREAEASKVKEDLDITVPDFPNCFKARLMNSSLTNPERMKSDREVYINQNHFSECVGFKEWWEKHTENNDLSRGGHMALYYKCQENGLKCWAVSHVETLMTSKERNYILFKLE